MQIFHYLLTLNKVGPRLFIFTALSVDFHNKRGRLRVKTEIIGNNYNILVIIPFE